MANKRFDVLSARPRKDSDKPYWHRVGTAWQGEKGINIVFDSLPLPDAEGRVSVSMFEPREQNSGQGDYRGNRGTGQSQAQSYADDLNDSVPF